MTGQDLKPGTVVYHKANNLRMVVLDPTQDQRYRCRFVSAEGKFEVFEFNIFELTTDKPSIYYKQLSASKQD